MASASLSCLSFLTGLVLLLPVCAGQLSLGFYNASCPNLTAIVSNRIDSILATNIGMAAGLLRLHFHDCFVRGCDASVLLNSTNSTLAEKDSTPNFNSLIGFVEIDLIKGDVEAACPGIVSCADILALAAQDATSKVGNVSWPVLLGRQDGLVSIAAEAVANLPSPSLNFAQLVASFASFGLDTKDMIVLTGAHTIGRTRCLHVIPRLYNFTGDNNSTDPTINSTFADFLKLVCARNSPNTFVALDSTSDVFDSDFYANVVAMKGVLASDNEILRDPAGLSTVNSLQVNSTFSTDFGVSMVKLGNLLATGAGEIRKSCAVIN